MYLVFVYFAAAKLLLFLHICKYLMDFYLYIPFFYVLFAPATLFVSLQRF